VQVDDGERAGWKFLAHACERAAVAARCQRGGKAFQAGVVADQQRAAGRLVDIAQSSQQHVR
jgi:hypothetical protein